MSSNPPPLRLSRPNILIVEDHPVLCEFMTSVASESGWQVVCAGSVHEFAQVFEAGHPDMIALDLGLPDGDGLDLLRALADRAYEGSIVIISGFDGDILDQCCELARDLGLNVTGRAQKPISADLLRDLLLQFEKERAA